MRDAMSDAGYACSPPARGWSLHLRGTASCRFVLPASAGMVPRRSSTGTPASRAPRQRGDGPGPGSPPSRCGPCSPPARGWSRREPRRRARCRVLPASAGMVPTSEGDCVMPLCAPRQRGDGPSPILNRYARVACSPPARGWSRSRLTAEPMRSVLPASAGMVPTRTPSACSMPCAPRQRGDGPLAVQDAVTPTKCSPPARGWSSISGARSITRPVLPASAGMVPEPAAATSSPPRAPRQRGDGPKQVRDELLPVGCSPPARGWSGPRSEPRGSRCVLPASAGMVPSSRRSTSAGCGAPRQRGDGPCVSALPVLEETGSPPARGWSHRAAAPAQRGRVLPASAGMVPSRIRSTLSSVGAPRQRGDGPTWSTAWTYAHSVLPASAGMVPSSVERGVEGSRAPRQRGDGPAPALRRGRTPWCSPPARGWSRYVDIRDEADKVLPASAGMVPGTAGPARRRRRAPRQRGDGPHTR